LTQDEDAWRGNALRFRQTSTREFGSAVSQDFFRQLRRKRRLAGKTGVAESLRLPKSSRHRRWILSRIPIEFRPDLPIQLTHLEQRIGT
jgi:hypothetical protein